MVYEYLSSLQSASRRINERLQVLAKRFGIDSKTYQKEANKVQTALQDNVRYNAKGVLQIAKPSNMFGDVDKENAVSVLDKGSERSKVSTWGDIRSQYIDRYNRETDITREFFSEEPSQYYTLEEYIEHFDNFQEYLNAIYENVEKGDTLALKLDDMMRIKGRLKTYEELKRVHTYVNNY